MGRKYPAWRDYSWESQPEYICQAEQDQGGYKKKMLEFVKTAPKYDGNPEKVFEWREQLETHL